MRTFGIITAYPTEDWHSRRLAEACAAHGLVRVVAPTDFTLSTEGVAPSADVWLLARGLGVAGDADFQLGVYQALSDGGARVVNPVAGLLAAEDKPRTSYLLARAGIPTPPAIAVQTIEAAAQAWDELGPSVVKPPYGSLGHGVTLLSTWDPEIAERMLADHGVIYLQRFVRPARGRRSAQDLRLFVVGDRVAAAMVRVAPRGELRTNVHLGGVQRAFKPDAALVRIAVAATRVLGLEYAGVDAMETGDGWTVIEVNGTPRWEGILEATGRDMADEIAAHAAWQGANEHVAEEGREEG